MDLVLFDAELAVSIGEQVAFGLFSIPYALGVERWFLLVPEFI